MMIRISRAGDPALHRPGSPRDSQLRGRHCHLKLPNPRLREVTRLGEAPELGCRPRQGLRAKAGHTVTQGPCSPSLGLSARFLGLESPAPAPQVPRRASTEPLSAHLHAQRLHGPDSESLGLIVCLSFDQRPSSWLQGNRVGPVVFQACLWRRQSLPPPGDMNK